MNEIISNLTKTPASQLQTAAFALIRDLPRGQSARLAFGEDPTMVLNSLNLRLRNNLSWTLDHPEETLWLATVRRAEDVPPSDVMDALRRDHKRLDALFSQVIHLTDRGRMADAAQHMQAFVDGLRRHLGVEHDMLAKAIRTRPDAMGIDPGAAMLAEHREILDQSAMICAGFDEPDADTESVSPLLAILAGYLSKHEQREESSLFPIWGSALAHAPQAARDALFARVLTQLDSTRDDGHTQTTST